MPMPKIPVWLCMVARDNEPTCLGAWDTREAALIQAHRFMKAGHYSKNRSTDADADKWVDRRRKVTVRVVRTKREWA